MSIDIELVKRVLQDVVYEATRLDGLEYDGKPIYQIEHVSLNNILARYRDDAKDEQ